MTGFIACSLTAAELGDRTLAWRRINDEALLGRDRTPEGVRLRFRTGPSVFADLSVLMELERECCPWMDGAVTRAGGEVVLELRADSAEGAEALGAMFGVG